MALKPVYINIGVSGGLDTKSDRKIVQPPSTLVANNLRYVTAGSVRKRYGITFLPQPSTSSNIASLGSTNDELLSADTSYMYAYNAAIPTWINRGTCPQTSLSVKTIEATQLPLGNSLTASTAQVRQITYDVVGSLGLAAWDTGDNISTTYGFNNLGSINLCLFDTTTGKAVWQTTIATPYIGAMGQVVSMGLYPSPATSTPFAASVSSTYTSQGCGYPVIVAWGGYFYLGYIGTLLTTDSRTTGSAPLTNYYYFQLFRLDPNVIASAPPVINANAYTNATLLMNGPGASLTVRQAAQATKVQPPSMFFDIATNGFDLTVCINAQSYNLDSSGNYALNGAASAYVAGFTSPTATSPANVRSGGPTPDGTAQLVSLSPSTRPGLTSTLPTDAVYFTAFQKAVGSVAVPSKVTPQPFGSFTTYDKPLTNSAPIDVYAIGAPGSGVYDVTVTDGVFYNRLATQSGSRTLTKNVSGLVQVDYSKQSNATPGGSYFYNPNVGPVLQSRIFLAQDGQPVAWVMLQAYNNSTFNCLALVNIGNAVTPPSVYAHAFYLRAGASLIGRQACNATNRGILAYQLTDVTNQVAAIKWVTLTNTPVPQISRLFQGALVTGADTKYYDGQSVRTLGWLKFPEIPPIAGVYVAQGGALINGFAYSYVAVWVDYDAYGNAIYSSPSPVQYLDLTTSAAPGVLNNGSAASSKGSTYILASAYPLLQPSRGQLILYRNSSKDPLNYRRIPPLTYQAAAVSSDGTPVPAYFDFSPDNNLANPLLYSQPEGGELPNDPPPSSLYAVTTIKRPFVSSAENTSWLYFGKPYFPGRAPEFNAEQFLDIDPPSGAITGLAILDQNVIIFKKERIFVLSGDGPDATGAGTFNNTYAVATDTGCLDSQSIVSTETGVYFRSIRGIQLLDRSLTVTYVGAPVENVIAGSSVTSACLIPGQNQIRWALASNSSAISGTGADNVVVVFDYFLKTWSTYGFNPGYSPAYSLKLIGQAVWQYNWFGLAGNAVFQDAGPNSVGTGGIQFVDGPNAVPMTLTTGWIPLAGPQGLGRLRWVTVLGDFQSSNTMTLIIYYDYNDVAAYNIDFTPNNVASGTPQEWRTRAPRQVAQSVKFSLTDSSTGEACVITGLLLETYQKSGAARLPDYQSV